jgi:tRNA (adenine22-N1)-methyltransferase
MAGAAVMEKRVKRLPPRLEAAAAWVPSGARLCDVGPDHARLPIALLRRGTVSSVLLTDVNPGPLERARTAMSKAGFLHSASFLLTDGLAGADPGTLDCVTMAGLGGETMAAILKGAPWTREKTMVLQPMQGLMELRSFLCAEGYQVTDETLAKEGERVYSVMAVTGGRMVLSPGELYVGPERFLRDHPLWPFVLEAQIRRFEDELAALTASVKEGDAIRAERAARVLNDLRRLRYESTSQCP